MNQRTCLLFRKLYRNSLPALSALAVVCLVSNGAFALPVQYEAKDLTTDKVVTVTEKGKGLVVVFLSARCPCSGSHEALLKAMPARFPDFTFVAIHSNTDEPESEAAEHFKKAALPFPVLQDHASKWATDFRAFKTPHAFVVSPQGEIVYQGGVTDSHVAANAKKQFLADALTDLQSGKPVRVREGRTLGCVIARASSGEK